MVDTGGNPLRGAPVTFSTTFGQLSQGTAISDAAGEARTQLTTNVRPTSPPGSAAARARPTAKVTVAGPVGAGRHHHRRHRQHRRGRACPTVFTLEPPAAATSNAIREVIVNFGDGTVRNIGSLLARTTVAYTYTRAGVYTVTATATDVMNFTATSSIAVHDQRGVDRAGHHSRRRPAPAASSTSAPASPAASAAARSGTYEWDFGDGGGATTTGPSTSHRYVAAGTYVVRLRVVTTTGQEGFAEQTVRVIAAVTPAPRAAGAADITSRCRACRRAPSDRTRS